MTTYKYIDRTISSTIKNALGQFPAIIVTGPRQSGKTTLVRHLLGETHRYCSLDDPSLSIQARQDPKLLLQRFPPPVILDEIQHAPELLRHVKLAIDENRQQRGQFVITGSQVFQLMQGVTESLAGRTAVLSLHSLSIREALIGPDLNTPWEHLLLSGEERIETRPLTATALSESIYRGGFPEPALSPEMDVRLWQSSYLSTYLERDVRSLRAIGDLGDFQRFLQILAARAGGLINFSEIARDIGVTGKTVRAWLAVLEASGHALVLKPFHQSLDQRLVKRPKVYLLDTGVLCHLLGLSGPEQVLVGAAAGPVFEAAVLGQLVRLFAHRGIAPRLSFWRTAAGHEVDFVIEHAGELIPAEARLTASPSIRDATGIEKFQRLFGSRAGRGLLVCLTPERHSLTSTVDAVPLGSF